METTTIAAVATPVGQGALAVIRMSGPDCLNILSCCARLPKNWEARRVTLMNIVDDSGIVIDQVLATWFRGPASYTGEDSVEVSCHGGMLVTRRVLERLFACGATPADPGEFTKRAFLNGRMDLTQAEAVMDIISAGSDLALKAAQEQLNGAIGHAVNQLAEDLIHLVAHVEAYIDFPEEDISPDTVGQMVRSLDGIRSRITRLLQTADQGRLFREGVRTAIVGEPNVGKSSLLNMLLGYERAIVSNIPGTTRDTVEESVLVGSLALRLVDTAGVRDAKDLIEQAGIERTSQAIASADLILEVVDASQEQGSTHRVDLPAGIPSLLILNKCDLAEDASWAGTEGVRFSCQQGVGKQELEQAIWKTFANKFPQTDGQSLASINARHQEALRRCVTSLDQAEASLQHQDSPELTALDLREAMDALGELTGKIDTEDILGAIFSTFCIGK